MKDYGWFQTSQMIFSNKDGGLSHPKLKAMAKMYNMDNVSNVEVVGHKEMLMRVNNTESILQ